MKDDHALLVEDHPLFALGLRAAWSSGERPPIKVANDLHTARAWSNGRAISLAIIDVSLPDGNGLDLVCSLAGRGVPVVVLTTDVRPAVALAARRQGAIACLSKELNPDELLRILDRIWSAALPASSLALACEDFVPTLTPREREVLAAVIDGGSNPEIAEQLGIGVETVKSHVTALMGRFGVHGRYELNERARELGFDLALPYLGDGR